jgi:hypothetical protein
VNPSPGRRPAPLPDDGLVATGKLPVLFGLSSGAGDVLPAFVPLPER